MWFSPLTASRSNDPGYRRWRGTPQPSGHWCCRKPALLASGRLLSWWQHCAHNSSVTSRRAPPSVDNGLLSMLWMISGLYCEPLSYCAADCLCRVFLSFSKFLKEVQCASHILRCFKWTGKHISKGPIYFQSPEWKRRGFLHCSATSHNIRMVHCEWDK